jgi:hypothetical protein
MKMEGTLPENHPGKNTIFTTRRKFEQNHVLIVVLTNHLKVKQCHYRPGQALRVPGG